MSTSPWLTDYDIHLFLEGRLYRSYDKLGAHFVCSNGERGVHIAVWAPHAKRVSVVGDFNNWDELANPLNGLGESGVWEGFVARAAEGQTYKLSIHSNLHDAHLLKADPYAFCSELRPGSASLLYNVSNFEWHDERWMNERSKRQKLDQPMTIYEMHLGSWRRRPEEPEKPLTYREIAAQLPGYLRDIGFTHVEFLPLSEHPLDGTWGYQSLGYFAPTSRYGSPRDLMHLIDELHAAGIGVILDWVPRQFPADAHGLAQFDGSLLYENPEGKRGYQSDRGTLSFNYGRPEVANFLISSALFWLDKYHIDGLRLDGTGSILYYEQPRDDDAGWPAVGYGGGENLEGISFLRRLNEVVYETFPDAFTVAEESTAWPMASRPTYMGGLGFGYKWNTGWANDVLSYMGKDAVYRGYHHNNLTFGLLYAFHENFVLPLSHNEVTTGRSSLLRRMAGDDWQKFANLRLLFGYLYGHPGKKLLFMGDEFGQWEEWTHTKSLDWHLLQHKSHQGLSTWVRDLNCTLRDEPALHEIDFTQEGFCWIDCHDHSNSVVSFLRRNCRGQDTVICIYNFTPVPRYNYRVGVPQHGYWEELLNSDADVYGGSGLGNLGGVFSESLPAFGQPYSVNVTLPPLAALFLRLSDA